MGFERSAQKEKKEDEAQKKEKTKKEEERHKIVVMKKKEGEEKKSDEKKHKETKETLAEITQHVEKKIHEFTGDDIRKFLEAGLGPSKALQKMVPGNVTPKQQNLTKKEISNKYKEDAIKQVANAYTMGKLTVDPNTTALVVELVVKLNEGVEKSKTPTPKKSIISYRG